MLNYITFAPIDVFSHDKQLLSLNKLGFPCVINFFDEIPLIAMDPPFCMVGVREHQFPICIWTDNQFKGFFL